MVFSQTESRPHPALGLGATVLLSEGGSATALRDLSREGSFVFWEASSVYKTKLGPPDNVYKLHIYTHKFVKPSKIRGG